MKIEFRVPLIIKKLNPYIWFTLSLIGMLLVFIGVELQRYDHSFHNISQLYYSYCKEMRKFSLPFILFAVGVKLLGIILIVLRSWRQLEWYIRYLECELEKRSNDFMFIDFHEETELMDVEDFCKRNPREMVEMKSFLLAHEDMNRSIERFRHKADKEIFPRNFEKSQELSELYSLLMNDQPKFRRLRDSYYKYNIVEDD